LLIVLAWMFVYSVRQYSWQFAPLGAGNILVGFGIMFIGFLMTTRWR
jgi:hypothetical protein